MIINLSYFFNYLRKKIVLVCDQYEFIPKLTKGTLIAVAILTWFFSWTIVLGYLLFKWYYLGNKSNYITLRKYFKKILWITCLIFFSVGFSILFSFYFYRWYILSYKQDQKESMENEINFNKDKENIIRVEF